jgi:hypothetical protein
MTERVSDDLLRALVESSEGKTWALLKYGRAMAQELIERRQGEYICPRCGLRQEGERDSNGEIPF